MPSLAQHNEDATRKAVDRTRATLSNYAERAAEILQELAEYADNDRIRLSAVNSILDRAGVVAPTEIKVAPSQEEHELIKREAEETMRRLQENAAHAAKKGHKPSLEAIIVHEGEGDDETA